MSVIHKFPLPPGDLLMVELPKSAQILHVAEQSEWKTQLWAYIKNETEPRFPRVIRRVPTGGDVPTVGRFINTVLHSNGLVFHYFEGPVRHGV